MDAALADTNHARHASLRATTSLSLYFRIIHSSSIQIFLREECAIVLVGAVALKPLFPENSPSKSFCVARNKTRERLAFDKRSNFRGYSFLFQSFELFLFSSFREFEKVENHVEYYVMSVNVHAANERGNVQVERVKD